MLSDTLRTELERYAIGPKLRALRLGKKMGLAELAAHTGLSTAMLSKIERGQLFPTLPTLLRAALVFGVGLEHFFAPTRAAVAVTRGGQRVRLPNKAGLAHPSYFFESLDFPASGRRMEAYLADFPSGAPVSEPHSHAGAELVFVIAGELRLDVAGEEVGLGQGDCAYFRSSQPHSYGGAGGAATALVVTVGEGRAGEEPGLTRA